jgi:hypothetical protein
MLSAGDGVYVQLQHEPDHRILYPGRIVSTSGALCTARIEEQDLPLDPGSEVTVYYRNRYRFVRQSARIDAITRVGSSPTVGLELLGKPVAAESRECFRVSTVASGVTARVGREEGCSVLDISATGFAVLATTQHPVGAVVPVTLRHEGARFTGHACVESVFPSGTEFRYGMRAVEDEQSGGNLPKGQVHIAMAVQRLQLRRLAGG